MRVMQSPPSEVIEIASFSETTSACISSACLGDAGVMQGVMQGSCKVGPSGNLLIPLMFLRPALHDPHDPHALGGSGGMQTS
jgi:hypothetical protein